MSKKGSNKRRLRRGFKQFVSSVKRKERERIRIAGFKRYISLLNKKFKDLGQPFQLPKYQRFRVRSKLGQKPKFNDWINFLAIRHESFSEISLPIKENGYLVVPENFSLSDGHRESMHFLKRLFNVLLKQNAQNVIIDYKNCKYLDLDASALMDIILAGFIEYYNKCSRRGHTVKIKEITPRNFHNPDIRDMLYSIGALANIKGTKLESPDIKAFKFRIGDNELDKDGRWKEVHETEIVDYVLDCLNEMGRSLTAEAETNLSKVVGEVMANSEEHSRFRYRFAIGYFKRDHTDDNDLGIFKLVIFNFGQTIYESFKRDDCPNTGIVDQMRELSHHYTKNKWFGLFGKKKFEEQTLWTLYALQERVTSMKDWRRGNGSIRFIDRFFKLKGDCLKDNVSKLTLISGNTHIIFDGTYPLKDIENENGKYKMMTFNDSGDIKDPPDKNFVTFADEFFPGTIISAKICITTNNIENL